MAKHLDCLLLDINACQCQWKAHREFGARAIDDV